MWENLLKRRWSTLRLIGDTTDRESLFLIKDKKIKSVVTEEKSCKRNRQYWNCESLTNQTGIMTIIQCTDMTMMLHMIITVGADHTAVCRLIVSVGDSEPQTRQIQRQQQGGNNPLSLYMSVCLHESKCKVTLFYRITHVYAIKNSQLVIL